MVNPPTKTRKCSGLKGKEKCRVNSKCTSLFVALPPIENLVLRKHQAVENEAGFMKVSCYVFLACLMQSKLLPNNTSILSNIFKIFLALLHKTTAFLSGMKVY